MLQLIYDYQIFFWQKYGGISRYIYEIATRLSQDSNFNVKILAMGYINEYLKDCKQNIVCGFPIPNIPKTGNIRDRFNYQMSKILLHQSPPAIIHETFYSLRKLAPKQTKKVLTVYDLTDEKFNPESEIIKHKAVSIKRADRIICISQNTKSDLIEILSVEPSKISVIYLGCSLHENELNNQSKQQSFDFPYILYVGERYGYKNFDRLLEAYASSPTLKKDFKLVYFGSAQLGTKELEKAKQMGIEPDSLVYCSGNDALLKQLYQEAATFVYPSLYEGFGIPPLEAMSLGCPVVCSNTSSLPEVVGEAAELFDPYNIENITHALETVLYSTKRTEKLRLLGRERAKLFSWQQCARQTKEVYLSLI
jgi:glycosyltransferase involved in cell wall biosynthesis